jgi:hypothetical protein
MRQRIGRAWAALAQHCSPPESHPDAKVATVRNLTPAPVTVVGTRRTLRLAPLASEPIEVRLLAQEFDRDRIDDSGVVEVDERVVVEPAERWFAHVVAVAALLAAVSLLLVIAFTTGWTAVIVWAGATSLAVVVLAGIGRDHASEVGRWMKEKLALGLVLLAGFGIPTVTLLFTTGLFDALRGDVGRALEPELSGVVTLRALQVLFLGVAIVFPALLYFLFDRQRADTLRTRFIFSMFRLDPRVRGRPDVDALYGRQMEEAFGAQLSWRPTRQLRFRHRSPMVITTVVLAVGWIVALINLDAIPLGGAEPILDLSRLFEPESNVLAFGFLGAYFFAVNSVLRSYVRGDLQPKAYSQITARVLVVAVLASVVAMTELGGNRLVVAVAFFAGIVPETVLQWTWEGVRELRPAKSGHRRAGRDEERDLMSENQPLTELDGIDLYERARLAAEGVANVEALAHGNLVDLLLQTRIPPGRLVDWVDQAVLYLHTALGSHRRDLFDRLRGLGVRTATDLLVATDDAQGRESLLRAIGAKHLSAERLDLLRRAMADAEWMANLLAWRKNEQRPPITVLADRRALSMSPPTGNGRHGSRHGGAASAPPTPVPVPSERSAGPG